MFNSIRQYLSLSHNDGHNNEYLHQDNSWRQQKNHLIGNWLSDMSQHAEDKESHRHFWNRRRKKYYKNDIHNDELYQQQQQQQQQLQHIHQHPPHSQPQHHFQQQPMFDRHRSHKSLSSLFRRDSKSNLMHQQLHQPMFGNEASGHEYRRQRHSSLPSSYNGKHKTGHQDNFLSGHHHQQPFLTTGSMQQNGFSKHRGLDSEFQQPYYPQQQQQQQHMQALNNAGRHSSYGQEPPIYSKSMQHSQHFPQQQQQQQQQQHQSYFNDNTGPSSARELQYQQQMLYYQQQQQQQQQFPYSGVNQGYRLGQNHNFYNNNQF
ncbi:hypothetical protein HPULCUR_001693 [Helicostylum pulchrum]|uniref:Uncharacterized protein n=1 Tax=Helicostylum pulchrum TaxID=562976 RepID=A0ABP9XPD1_9FUNG